jgi:arylsulfatase A-like enzyme/tetratricopeptide (TPR) repeat protein
MKLRLATVGALLVLSGSVTGVRAAQVTRPPVLLITIDTLRQDALSTYGGSAEAPALSALAGRGVRFDNAVAHAVMTLPSHTSILTGLDPSRHGVHDNHGFRVSDVLDTWAERLQAEGYATGAFIGAFPLDSRFGLAQGFDTYDDFVTGPGDTSYLMPERSASAVVAAARRWIRRERDSWFAWVHVYDPHAPYLPPPPFDEQYRDDPYAGEIAYTDSALAPLLADAERMGALIIVTSDHGEARGQHGEQTHGVLAYNPTIRVPLIVAGPGVAAGVAVARRVGHADILPTVLERLGLDRGAAQGKSFNDILESGDDQGIGSEAIYFEALTPNLTRNWAPLRGVFRGDWKFIDLPLPELYDVTTDPGELSELSRSRGSMMVELNGVLREHLAGALAVDSPLAEDPETRRRLQALGYLGGSSGGGTRDYGPEDDPKNLIHLDAAVQRAVRELEAGEINAAIVHLEAVLKERPDFVSAILKLATAEVGRGDLEAGIARLQAAAQEEWATTHLRRGLGVYLLAAGRLDEAAAVLQQVIEEDPGNIEAMNVLSTVHRDAGRPGEAMRQVEAALLLDPTYAELHLNRGELLVRAGRLVEAQEALQRALTYDPRLSSAHNMLGKIAFDDGRPAEAIEHWRTAIAHNPADYKSMRNLGIELVKANRFAEGVDVLEQLFKAVPPGLEEEYQIMQLRVMVVRIKRDQGIR